MQPRPLRTTPGTNSISFSHCHSLNLVPDRSSTQLGVFTPQARFSSKQFWVWGTNSLSWGVPRGGYYGEGQVGGHHFVCGDKELSKNMHYTRYIIYIKFIVARAELGDPTIVNPSR